MKSILFMLLSAFYSRTVASQIANDIEAQLRANRDAYIYGQRTRARQQAALAYFDSTWANFSSENGCGSTLLGSAGRACIEDRLRSGRWPFEVWYRDLIVNAQPAD